jgi:parallel beta-helix repeat protein
MKNVILYFILMVLLIPLSIQAVTLQEVYNAAQPGLGYDKLLELHKDSIYLGGLLINNTSVGIKGHGAVIDLQYNSIVVAGNSTIELDACVITNGTLGIDVQGTSDALITHCTFYNNQIGIHFLYSTGSIEVKNTILSNNYQFGFACDEYVKRTLHYIDAYQNPGGDYMEWCAT